MNEKRIQQVLKIEEQAQAICETATHDAEQLQAKAVQDAQVLIETTREAARAEAQQLIEDAQAQEECAYVMAQADEQDRRIENLALSHFDRAVGYVLDRVAGKE